MPRIHPDLLERERASWGDLWFRQEYMCEFVGDDESLFDRELIDAALCSFPAFQPALHACH